MLIHFYDSYENASCPTPETSLRHRSMISDTEHTQNYWTG